MIGWLRAAPRLAFACMLLDTTATHAQQAPDRLAGELGRVVRAEGADAARARYRRLRADSAAQYPVSESALNALGYELLAEGRAREAVVIMDLAREAFPTSANAQDSFADAALAAGDSAGAEAALRRTLDYHPDSPLLLNNLAHVLSDLGHDAEALDLIQRAARAPGPHAAAVDETRAVIMKRLATGDRAAR